MRSKIRVGILFGGKSAEHEVSLQSAKNVIEAIDREKYDVTLIGIDKTGRWRLSGDADFLLSADDPKAIHLQDSGEQLAVAPGAQSSPLTPVSGGAISEKVDVVFPILHGPLGEDGTVQGLLKLANLPFVGAGVLGSAVGMDKDVMKRLLREAGIPNAASIVVHRRELKSVDFQKVTNELGLPVFVKPANLGSSVGISKARNLDEFARALSKAFRFDNKILIEEFIKGREIECSVLGNEDPIASVPGEIIPQHEFYSYEAKYLDENGALLEIPAKLPPETVERVKELAVKTYKTLCCEGMARVDMFLREDDSLYINEINTIPGFTKISMYPKLWEASGIGYAELIDRLIQLALERHEGESKLNTNVEF
jgi:D-alanine-D-alanine ligase